LGFRNIEIVGTLHDFSDALRHRPPDVALCESQVGEAQLCDVVQRLRQDSDSSNPFILVMVATWTLNSDLANLLASSGADDVLLRPFSTAFISQRIEAHVSRRKGFIVTSDYVGPERRKGPTRASRAFSIDPPNSLKIKSDERLNPNEAARRLDEELIAARAQLNVEKLRCDSSRICILGKLLQHEPAGSGRGLEIITRITTLIGEIKRRIQDTEYRTAEDIIPSALDAAKGMQSNVDRVAAIKIFEEAALQLAHAIHPDKSVAELSNEISATVAVIQAKQQNDSLGHRVR
jgi:DNA-binding response OmpR family regulator